MEGSELWRTMSVPAFLFRWKLSGGRWQAGLAMLEWSRSTAHGKLSVKFR
jgi:hypothetical protein